MNTAADAYEVPLTRRLGCAAFGVLPPALFISGVANGLLVSW